MIIDNIIMYDLEFYPFTINYFLNSMSYLTKLLPITRCFA